MKIPQGHATDTNGAHPWVTTLCVVFGIAAFAVAVFWFKKCKSSDTRKSVYGENKRSSRFNKDNESLGEYLHGPPRYYSHVIEPKDTCWMFNLYQSINKKDEGEKELDVIGHDRFYQERPSRSSSRRKKKIARRTRSVAEFDQLDAAQKRAAFKHSRSRSSEQNGKKGLLSPQKSGDSLTKVFFSKRSNSPKHEYSALRLDGGPERSKLDKEIRDGAFATCSQYLANNERYELQSHLGSIGSRSDKNWFVIEDRSLKAERLLTVVPLTSTCPIQPSTLTKETVLSLFRSLQHPYIHPVLDVEFWEIGAALVSPLNPSGSLRDIIYGCTWHDDYEKKYRTRGEGLPLKQVQCLGRQILEALLFLRNRQFPPFYHLHTGNVIIQNGVARLAGLENPLFGLLPRPPSAPEILAFGYLLYEVTLGYELTAPPSPAHLELELDRAPRVADVLTLIFQSSRLPTIEDVLCCDLFRGVELRELRGAGGAQSLTMPADVVDLLNVVKYMAAPPPIKRKDVALVMERRKLEDILEEEDVLEDDSVSIEFATLR